MIKNYGKDEVLNMWDDFSQANQFAEIISNPNRKYYEIWKKLSPTIVDRLLQQPDLDYTHYIGIMNDEDMPILYAHNKKLMLDIDWDKTDNRFKNSICRNNKYFEYKKVWDKLTKSNKDVISNREDFDYEKYWDELTEYQRSNIIRREDFDFDKYWDDLTPGQSLVYMYKAQYCVDSDKISKIIDGLSNNKIACENLFNEFNQNPNFDETLTIEIDGEHHGFLQFKIDDMEPDRKLLIVELLKNINSKTIYTTDSLFEKNKSYGGTKTFSWNKKKYKLKQDGNIEVTKYKGDYIIPQLFIYIKDYSLVLREDKLKRILEI